MRGAGGGGACEGPFKWGCGGDPFKGGIEEGTPVWGPLNEGPFKRGVFGGTPLVRSFGGPLM